MAFGKKAETGAPPDIDMTPMIDVVFQLLTFFMLVTELSSADIEAMQLPNAKIAKPDDKPPKGRLVVNIVKQDETNPNNREGVIKIKGKQYSANGQDLIQILVREADPSGTGKDRDKDGNSERPLLVRCDRRVEYQYFQQVLMLCANPSLRIRIYKLQIGISKKGGAGM